MLTSSGSGSILCRLGCSTRISRSLASSTYLDLFRSLQQRGYAYRGDDEICFGITATGDGTAGGFTIQPFPYRDNIRAAGGIPPTDLNRISGDNNNDRLTDSGYDVTVTLADVFTVAAGASATYVTQTVFGQGSPQAILNPGLLQFSAPDFRVDETAGSVTVTVSRTQGNVGVVSVDYALLDGTATAGQDYTASSGTLVFQDQQTTATFVVPMANVEPDAGWQLTPGASGIASTALAINVATAPFGPVASSCRISASCVRRWGSTL